MIDPAIIKQHTIVDAQQIIEIVTSRSIIVRLYICMFFLHIIYFLYLYINSVIRANQLRLSSLANATSVTLIRLIVYD